ncbi:thiol reductant ABC exporter subunit CydC [Actinoplanes sp. Pm04-4]|uniref:Thiol reductant ABC exporter subunit CydC n=1 Tax=Paractinoplanes pyxinae TaxID=2997416 RepID=A0ABT4AWD9_9ACTN|nr:thiol reductant ABC exporter subunit CydC [Actinoplanes pyxinae]MCY1138532.1 thiol reductant ABC exporter subunit CydC [Actinoplanes pyxinae]
MASQRSAPPRGPLDPRLVRHARTSRGGIAGLALLGAGQAGATLLVAVALTMLVTRGPGWAALLLALAYVARALLSWGEQVVARRTAARVTDELRRSMLRVLPQRGPAWVATFGAGRLTAVLTTGLDALKPWFSGYLPALVLGVALPPLVIVAMAVVDPTSAVIALVTLPLIPVLGALIGWATQARARQRWQADARLAGHFLDVVRGLPTLRVFGRADRQTEVIETLTDQHRSATLRVLRVAFLSSTALDLVGTLSVGLIAVEAGLRVAAGNLALGPALLVILLAPEAYRPLREMAARYHASTDATAIITDVDEILTAPALATAASTVEEAVGASATTNPAAESSASAAAGDTEARPATPGLFPIGVAGGTGTSPAGCGATAGPSDTGFGPVAGGLPPAAGVVVSGLRSRYPGATRDAAALEQLVVRPGEIVALAGPSGAGKTTVLRVLAGLQTAHTGAAHATNPLYLPQRPALPHARTVADLFPTGTSAADITDALTTVGLATDLTPATQLGERGTGVSAGQRHRLALAALLHQVLTPTAATPQHPDTTPNAGVRHHPATGPNAAAPQHPAAAPNAATPQHQATTPNAAAPQHPDTTPNAAASHHQATTPNAGASPHRAGTPTARQPGTGALIEAALLPLSSPPARGRDDSTIFRAPTSASSTGGVAAHSSVERPDKAPATLLLDEPTAHLDPAGEALVIARLREAARAGCAILVVAHRAALLAAADRVVRLVPPATPGTETPFLATADVPLPGHAGLATAGTAGTKANSQASAPTRTLTTGTGNAVRLATAETPLTLEAAASPAGTERAEASPAGTEPTEASPAGTEPAETEAATEAAETEAAATRHDAYRSDSPTQRPWWRRAGVAVALGSGSSLAGLVLTGAAAWLLVRASFLPPVLTLSTAVVLVRGSAVARPLLRYLERLVAHDVAFARLGVWRARVFAALIPRVPGPRLRRRGDLLTKVADDVDARVDGLLRGRMPFLVAAATVAVAVSAAVLLSPLAALPLMAGVFIAGVLAPALAARQAARDEAATGEARARLRDAMVETVDGLEDLRTGDDVPQKRSRDLALLEARAARTAGWSTALAHLGWGVAVTGVAFALGGLSAEWAAVLLLATVALGEIVLTLPDAAVARQRAAGAEVRLAGLTSEPPAATPRDSSGSTGFRLERVTAAWADPVLDGLDLDLPAGSRVAVLGRSGSGKSTLAAVLAGFLDPRDGVVTRGRGRVVLVGDDTGHIFASTVRENLRLARPGATDDELLAVLHRVRLGTWFDALPQGLDTWLGGGGTTMSGGQARRFAVARALLAGPALLILDEPTEGLDAEVAEELMADLLGAADMSVLVLTHRAEGLDRVDRVLELSAGRVRPAGIAVAA